ncbi:phage holin [Ktedonospora formicarum]|uniref:Holin n=1 Tax=Ktedonospora formicarum TaxID=2778364 RepID=A0A8J3I0E1_9CHLR|nr:phage holin [Ktedonospora formicarum]GHO44505.1 hypothetical protein KSX_26680 [Ktedonospora formicarum]
MNFQLTDAEIQLIAAIVVPFVISAAGALFKLLIEKLPSAQRANAEKLVEVAVKQVEQQCKGLEGPEKRAEAVALLQTLLKAAHINVPSSIVESLIEAVVFEINKDKPQA